MSADNIKKIQQKDRLFLHWGAVVNEGSGKIKLVKPFFEGPVLTDCEPVDESGELLLDFTDQCLILLVKPYEIKISWNKKIYQDNSIVKFDEIILEDLSFGHLTRLIGVSDCILIDCGGHH